ncbi:UDP-3-O-(3-hydroxymyristoyl)glucosamine N-acyltransferase [Knoellia koreensis]|uniref:Transferase n=1 Tax=Knoellia koreensis TaxID=2730921 RepID=A0A849HET9_9MICO|nr:UDP-3-O-(3-hydroxymyristoyl)glucosamine N-acyltransferase [Knoellia sp. DB2414S]NNM45782.1 transferase [Knoellia sp. DB2414S]
MHTFGDVARVLGTTSRRPDASILGVSASSSPEPGTLSFIQAESVPFEAVSAFPDTLFLVPNGSEAAQSDNTIEVANPRLAYALVLRDLLVEEHETQIAPTSVVGQGVAIGESVTIGDFCVLEDGVQIGDYVVIGPHSVLRSGVRVGPYTRIGSHASIGGPGFGFEMDESGRPIRIGHRGGVDIGAHVEIGQQVSIAQGTIEPTVIRDHVKIDDCVFIAHNVSIDENSFIIAGAEISGSVRIGRGVWISPEVTVINKVSIGDEALVGIGAVVVRDVEANTIVAGVPAKPRGQRRAE